jgi:hypothetical protein
LSILLRCLFGAYRGGMEFLRGPLYLDVAAKGLCFVGVALMVFGRGGWFTAGVITVVLGVLFGAWEMLAVRKMRPRGWDGFLRAGRTGDRGPGDAARLD